MKRSNGASRKNSVRSKAAMARAEVVVVDGAPVGLLERLLVLGVVRDGRDRGVAVGLPHLDRVQDRQLGLLLERRRAAVPELRLEEERRSAWSARCAGRACRRCPRKCRAGR